MKKILSVLALWLSVLVVWAASDKRPSYCNVSPNADFSGTVIDGKPQGEGTLTFWDKKKRIISMTGFFNGNIVNGSFQVTLVTERNSSRFDIREVLYQGEFRYEEIQGDKVYVNIAIEGGNISGSTYEKWKPIEYNPFKPWNESTHNLYDPIGVHEGTIRIQYSTDSKSGEYNASGTFKQVKSGKSLLPLDIKINWQQYIIIENTTAKEEQLIDYNIIGHPEFIVTKQSGKNSFPKYTTLRNNKGDEIELCDGRLYSATRTYPNGIVVKYKEREFTDVTIAGVLYHQARNNAGGLEFSFLIDGTVFPLNSITSYFSDQNLLAQSKVESIKPYWCSTKDDVWQGSTETYRAKQAVKEQKEDQEDQDRIKALTKKYGKANVDLVRKREMKSGIPIALLAEIDMNNPILSFKDGIYSWISLKQVYDDGVNQKYEFHYWYQLSPGKKGRITVTRGKVTKVIFY